MKRTLLSLALFGCSGILFALTTPTIPFSLVETSEDVAQEWMYTWIEPASDWNTLDFNDVTFEEGFGGFGSAGFAHVRTEWNSVGKIYLRKEFTAPLLSTESLAGLKLRMFNDDDVKVYINGGLAYERLDGWETKYVEKAVGQEALGTFNNKGKNVLAVVCNQKTGGQYIDCGLFTTVSALEILPTADAVAAPGVMWHYTETDPGENFSLPGYVENQSWLQGGSGFGGTRYVANRGTAKTNTNWADSENTSIWLRKTLTIPPLTAQQLSNLQFKIFYDDDVNVYLNGVLAFSATGFTQGYVYKKLSAEAIRALVPGGNNTLAIRCNQKTGGQYIDCGLYTSINVVNSLTNLSTSKVSVYVSNGLLNVTGRELSKIDILDVCGTLVETIHTSGDACKKDVTSLTPGVYMASVVSEGQTTIVKFIR